MGVIRNAAVIKCAIFCVVLTFSVIILRILHSNVPYEHKYYEAYVDYAILTTLHPASFSSPPANSTTTNSIRLQLALNITFRAYDRTGDVRYHDCSATALYKDTILDAPQDWISDEPWTKGPSGEMVWTDVSFRSTVAVYPNLAAELQTERAEGTVHVRVRLSATVIRRVWLWFRSVIYNDYDCWLWFPPPGGDAAPAVFGEGTQCWPVK